MKELLVATKNEGKLNQMREFLAEVPLVVRSLAEFEIDDGDFAEDGLTFAENAFKKADYYGRKLGEGLVVAEDSGIFVEALPGELGVFTRRWGAGAAASDEEWMAVFMERMAGVEDRRARFVANVCLWIDGEAYHFEKENHGVITAEVDYPLEPGIPLSSCFLPNGHQKVYARFSPEERLKISHRGQAMAEAREFIKLKVKS
ncbi:non-canonical purine NTP pyrophosphatase [Candidatus Gracilibacteria bacterium]|nr:non-canonical purine NTP pyrophosphatase [Candidatus Gracilibacteria bacterium]